jgi:hypothetical protein
MSGQTLPNPFEPYVQLSVRGKRLDGCGRVFFASERFAEQIEKKVELNPVHAAQRGQPQRRLSREAVASAGDLRRLFAGERSEQSLRVRTINYGARAAPNAVMAGLTKAWCDAQRFAREPARACCFAGRFPRGPGVSDCEPLALQLS